MRNREIAFEPNDDPRIVPVIGSNLYDDEAMGGTTAVVIGPYRAVIKTYVASSGTIWNCAGDVAAICFGCFGAIRVG